LGWKNEDETKYSSIHAKGTWCTFFTVEIPMKIGEYLSGKGSNLLWNGKKIMSGGLLGLSHTQNGVCLCVEVKWTLLLGDVNV